MKLLQPPVEPPESPNFDYSNLQPLLLPLGCWVAADPVSWGGWRSSTSQAAPRNGREFSCVCRTFTDFSLLLLYLTLSPQMLIQLTPSGLQLAAF